MDSFFTKTNMIKGEEKTSMADIRHVAKGGLGGLGPPIVPHPSQ